MVAASYPADTPNNIGFGCRYAAHRINLKLRSSAIGTRSIKWSDMNPSQSALRAHFAAADRSVEGVKVGPPEPMPIARSMTQEAIHTDITLTIRGFRRECWKCHHQALVPYVLHTEHWQPDPTSAQGDPSMLSCEQSPSLLVYIKELLGYTGHSVLSGTIKPRRSKTVDASYLSHGCPECDALFGEFPLQEDWFDIIDRWHDGADIDNELCEIVTTPRPVLEWLLLAAERDHLIGE